jgi:hypothetical protein
MPDKGHHIIIKFGQAIPYDIQCRSMLMWEKQLRAETGIRVEVFGHTRGDDSKLRALMTPEQRGKL